MLEACFTSTLISANSAAATSIQLDFIERLRGRKKTGGVRRPLMNLEKAHFRMRLDLAPQESMEMHHAVFQRRLIDEMAGTKVELRDVAAHPIHPGKGSSRCRRKM